MKKITLLMLLAAMLTNGWAQSFYITTYQDCGKNRPITGTENGYTWVNLGLPSGLKWATCNVGAANPWDYGDYFAWGETVGYGKNDPSNANNQSCTGGSTVKTGYSWCTYKYCSGTSFNTLTKYSTNTSGIYGSVVDNKTTLDLADDAAAVNMGGSWRMPTIEEQQELKANCYWEWTDSYNGKGVAGYIVYKVKNASDKGEVKPTSGSVTTVGSYSLADPHIFLPAAGYRYGSGLSGAGGNGNYWSSSLYDYGSDPNYAYSLIFSSDRVGWDGSYRYYGPSVRAVVE